MLFLFRFNLEDVLNEMHRNVNVIVAFVDSRDVVVALVPVVLGKSPFLTVLITSGLPSIT